MRFDVAFWGTKSEMYMREIVPAILGRMKDGSKSTPIFVWSAKECEVTKFEDGIPIACRKPLQKVFWRYPHFSYSNTVMIDHNSSRLGGNPYGNLIVPTAFYVAELQKVGDDNAFLKASLWPQLQSLYRSRDVEHFREQFPESEVLPTVPLLNVMYTGAPSTTSATIFGEGTCGT
jgi:hypothetical protein